MSADYPGKDACCPTCGGPLLPRWDAAIETCLKCMRDWTWKELAEARP